MRTLLPDLKMIPRLFILTGVVLTGFAVLLALVLTRIEEVRVGGPIDEAIQAHAEIRYRLAMLRADLNEIRRLSATALSIGDPHELDELRQRARALGAVAKLQFHEVLGMVIEEPVRVALADANFTLEEFARANDAMLGAIQVGRRRALGALVETQKLRQERFAAQVDSAIDALALPEDELEQGTGRVVARHLRVVVVGGVELREVSRAFNQMAERVHGLQQVLTGRIVELEQTLAEVKQLQGLLPICAYCKKIRDDANYWHQVDGYLSAHLDVQFTHGVCPACRESVMKGLERTSS